MDNDKGWQFIETQCSLRNDKKTISRQASKTLIMEIYENWQAYKIV